jgi:hypothetical protein
MFFDDLFQLGMLLGDFLKMGSVGYHFGRRELLGKLIVACAQLI